MRELWIKAPAGQGPEILDLARQYQGSNLFMVKAHNQDQAFDIVVVNLSNQTVSEILQQLEGRDELEVTLHPQDVYPLTSAGSEVPDAIVDVSPRSPAEVWLNGLQSVGSWKSFLGYTAAGSIIAWTGMYTNTVYLLVAAMLVAPFAGPAMNFALATATGDVTLLWRNLLRYFVSLLAAVGIAAALSLLFQQQITTTTMVQISEISSLAVLLPLVAGAVGALNLAQPENSSLVPGTAVGVLVAASLAPPAVLTGMALALGRWDLMVNGIFLLVLQLAAINTSGSLVFRLYQLTPQGSRFKRGKPAWFYASLSASLLLLVGLLIIQFRSTPDFQRSTRAQRAATVVQQVIQEDASVELVETNLRFTRPFIQENNKLLGVIYVQRQPQAAQTNDQIQEALTSKIQERLLDEGFNVTPLISVTVLETLR